MKKSHLVGAVCACVISFISIYANAVGVPGQGTWETTLQGRNLDSDATTFEAYYDTTLDITWLTNTNFCAGSVFDDGPNPDDGIMTWDNAHNCAAQLNIGGIIGWRLPTISPVNGSTFDVTFTTNATSDQGYAATTTDGSDGGWRDGTGAPTSEMGHMFYVTLGNIAVCPTDGGDGDPTTCDIDSAFPPGWGLSNTGPFSFFDFPAETSVFYWSDSLEFTTSAFNFNFHWGNQFRGGITAGMQAWVVHDGDVGDISPLVIEKLTNGNQADHRNATDMPHIAQGELVNWTYEVTNTTASALSEAEIVITDSQPGVVPVLDTASDTGDDLILSPGETWTYTATAQALDLEGPAPGVTIVQGCGYQSWVRNTYENTGRAEIVGVGVVSEDLSHYCNPFDPTVDSDNDGMPDVIDNCIDVSNGPSTPGMDPSNMQRDTDGDRYGNICDADLNNDGIVNLSDYSAFRAAFGGAAPLTPPQENADFNGDGFVNLSDYSTFRSFFGKEPGPSCCGL